MTSTLRDGTISAAVIHAALVDVLNSGDPVAPEALAFMCDAGMPRTAPPGQTPYTILAARRHRSPQYTQMLSIMKFNNFDFKETFLGTTLTAIQIMEDRAPGLYGHLAEAGVRP